MASVLLADDNQQIATVVVEYLKREGHTAFVAKDGLEALALFRQHQPDAVLLDVMMPRLDGFSVCREIRGQSSVPIIMVTARGEDYERIMGLDMGADDYIVKPFSPTELMARLRAVLRRMTQSQQDTRQPISLGNLVVDIDSYRASVGGQEAVLTRRELELLYTLAASQDRVFSREQLLESLWGYDYLGDTRTVDSHIKRLRAKLDVLKPKGWHIRTIWGVGYRMEALPEGQEAQDEA